MINADAQVDYYAVGIPFHGALLLDLDMDMPEALLDQRLFPPGPQADARLFPVVWPQADARLFFPVVWPQADARLYGEGWPQLHPMPGPGPGPRAEAIPRGAGGGNAEQRRACSHEQWRRRGGPARCGMCRGTVTRWITVCRQCNLAVCSRCRAQRL